MRPGGREVEKEVGSALSVTPENGNSTGKADWYANMVDAPRYFLPKIPSLTFTSS